jgi:hypothetical protein
LGLSLAELGGHAKDGIETDGAEYQVLLIIGGEKGLGAAGPEAVEALEVFLPVFPVFLLAPLDVLPKAAVFAAADRVPIAAAVAVLGVGAVRFVALVHDRRGGGAVGEPGAAWHIVALLCVLW